MNKGTVWKPGWKTFQFASAESVAAANVIPLSLALHEERSFTPQKLQYFHWHAGNKVICASEDTLRFAFQDTAECYSNSPGVCLTHGKQYSVPFQTAQGTATHLDGFLSI